MGIHGHDVILGSGSVVVVRNRDLKILSELGSSTERPESQRDGILLKENRSVMLMRTSKIRMVADFVTEVDLETGQVVNNWTLQKEGVRLQPKKIGNDSKQPCASQASTFFTLDESRLSQWDVRSPKGVVDEFDSLMYAGGNQYASKRAFESMAVNGLGDVALGLKDGAISLYTSGVLGKAKEKLPKLNGSIRNLDLSHDGSLLLATLDYELVLLNTTFVDKEGKSRSAFKRSGFKGSTTRSPILLKLTTSDALTFSTGHTLHDGRFSWIKDKKESFITACGGRCVYVWRLDTVTDATHDCYRIQADLKICYCYQIHILPDFVVDSSFQHWDENISRHPSILVSTKKSLRFL